MTKQTPPPPGGVETDLNSGEFFAAIVMAATWFFLGPWGIIPTIWFAYMIADARPELLATGRRLLPASVRNHLAEMKAEVLELGWRLPGLRLPALAQAEDDEPEDDGADAVVNPTGAEFIPQPEPEQAAPPTAQPRRRSGPPKPEEVALERGVSLLDRPLYSSNPDEAWGPTLIAAKPRHGKSQVQIARLIEDVESDAEVVWMSTHATLYHPKDQPVDLRPLADRFELIGDGKAIKERLSYYVNTVMEDRLGRYRRGEDVGHPIAIHVGEWPALYAQYGEDVAAPMRRLLREAPKTQLIVSTLDAQDAQVNTLGLGSGLRNCFWHVLLGNVDEHSWRAFTDDPYREVPARSWFVPGQGMVRFPQATERARRLVAAQPVTQAAQLPLPEPARAPTAQLVRRAAEPAQVAARPVPAAEPMPDLLAELLATMSPERAARLQALASAEPSPAAQSIEVDGDGRRVTFNNNIHLPPVTASATKPTRKRREGAVNVRDRQRRLERKAYYEQAAREGVSLTKAYEARPAGEKGDYNEASMWYRAAKARIIAS